MKTANVMDLSAGLNSYKVNADNSNSAQKTKDTVSLFGSLMNQFGSADLWSQVHTSVEAHNVVGGADEYHPADYGNSYYEVGNSNISTAAENTIADQVDAAKEQIDQFEDTVVQTVSDQLGVSQEEVEKAMENMGISVFDLLDPKNLGQLVMNLTGMEERSQLLVDTDFQSLMNQIGQLGSDLMKELNLEMTQMNELIQQMDVLETPIVLDEGNAGQAGIQQESEEFSDVTVVPVEQEPAAFAAKEPTDAGAKEPTVVAAKEPTDAGEKEPTVVAAKEPTVAGAKEPTVAGEKESGSLEQEKAVANEQSVAGEILEYEEAKLTEQSVTAVRSEELSTAAENQTSPESPVVSGQRNAQDTNPDETGLDGVEADEQEVAQTVSAEGNGEQTASGQEDSDRDFSASAQSTRRPQQIMTNDQEIAGMNMEVSVGDTVMEAPQNEISYVDFNTLEFINQVAENVRTAVQNQVTTLEMQLNPEHLGKILVSLTSKEGAVNAQFMAANETVRAALEAQISTLRDNLNQAGVKVDAIEVTVETHEFEQNLEQNARGGQEQAAQQERRNSGRRNITFGSLDELSGMMSEEERLVAQIMQDNGNSMDVTV